MVEERGKKESGHSWTSPGRMVVSLLGAVKVGEMASGTVLMICLRELESGLS